MRPQPRRTPTTIVAMDVDPRLTNLPSITMEKVGKQDEYTVFKFKHHKSYQKIQAEFLKISKTFDPDALWVGIMICINIYAVYVICCIYDRTQHIIVTESNSVKSEVSGLLIKLMDRRAVVHDPILREASAAAAGTVF